MNIFILLAFVLGASARLTNLGETEVELERPGRRRMIYGMLEPHPDPRDGHAEVELSALDTLEALLANHLIGHGHLHTESGHNGQNGGHNGHHDGHLQIGSGHGHLNMGVPKGRACCRAYTADCMACAAEITVKEYCAKNPATSGCPTEVELERPGRRRDGHAEVELSALDILEALLATHLIGKPKPKPRPRPKPRELCCNNGRPRDCWPCSA